MRIAVDVMGGDHGCAVVIAGVRRALEDEQKISTFFWSAIRRKSTPRWPRRGFRDHRVRKSFMPAKS
jgi:fatty acid/phospholipid biosynthesis enzyme